MQALREEQFPGGSPGEGVDGLMRVTGAEAAEEDGSLIRAAIAIGVAEMHQLRAAPDIDAPVAPLDAAGNHQAIGEHRGPIGPTVAVAILEDEDLVFRRLSGADLRIHGAAHDPKSTVGIEANLDGLHHALALRGKQGDIESRGDPERGTFGFRIGRVARHLRRRHSRKEQEGEEPGSQAGVHCREGS